MMSVTSDDVNPLAALEPFDGRCVHPLDEDRKIVLGASLAKEHSGTCELGIWMAIGA